MAQTAEREVRPITFFRGDSPDDPGIKNFGPQRQKVDEDEEINDGMQVDPARQPMRDKNASNQSGGTLDSETAPAGAKTQAALPPE